MIPLQKETFPVNITVQVRKNIYCGEVYFDNTVNLTFHHEVSESEEYYIKTILAELAPRYHGKGKFFLLLDMRNFPKVGVTILPLDKLDELYTFTKYKDNDTFLGKNID
jgi:hypothetical protein